MYETTRGGARALRERPRLDDMAGAAAGEEVIGAEAKRRGDADRHVPRARALPPSPDSSATALLPKAWSARRKSAIGWYDG